MTKKFVDKKQARTFKVVNRSLNETVNENEPQLVLQETTRNNANINEELVDIEGIDFNEKPLNEKLEDERFGEAAKFGVFHNDTDYDYMQHLKKVGTAPGAVLVQAKTIETHDEFETIKQLNKLLYNGLENVNVDENVAQALEALEDEAFVQQDFEDDFVRKMNLDSQSGQEDDEEISLLDFSQEIEQKTLNHLNDLDSLDEQFEKVLKTYDSYSETDSNEEELRDAEEFEEIFDEFMENQEIHRGTLKECLPERGIDSVAYIRSLLADPKDKERIQKYQEQESEDDENIYQQFTFKEKPMWDCQSFITTNSNLENRPVMILSNQKQKIKLDKRGMPKIQEESLKEEEPKPEKINKGTARKKDETAEERKERKAAIKQENQTRRKEKKEQKSLQSAEEARKKKDSTFKAMKLREIVIA